MRTIIAGSRGFDNYDFLKKCIEPLRGNISEVISGGARGADKLGERWALENGIPVKLFPADWDRYGKSAGYRRNEVMAENADMLIAFWDRISRGTKHMIDIAGETKRIEVFVY